MPMHPGLRGMIVSGLKQHPGIARLVSRGLRRASAGRIAGKIDRVIGHIDDVVPINIPSVRRRPAFRMESQGGQDLIVSKLWYKGWGGFEKAFPDTMIACARESSGVFLDIGANTGLYSLCVRAANPGLTIHAFEPYPPVVEILRRNLRLNGETTAIRVFEQAVGAHPGEAELYVPHQDFDVVETSCSLNHAFRKVHERVVRVPVVTVDGHVASEGIGRVDLMKVDVEGFEDRVLSGAMSTIERFRPTVFIEVGSADTVALVEATRASCGYTVFQFHQDRVIARDRVRFDSENWNYCLVPNEKAGRFRTLASVLAG